MATEGSESKDANRRFNEARDMLLSWRSKTVGTGRAVKSRTAVLIVRVGEPTIWAGPLVEATNCGGMFSSAWQMSAVYTHTHAWCNRDSDRRWRGRTFERADYTSRNPFDDSGSASRPKCPFLKEAR